MADDSKPERSWMPKFLRTKSQDADSTPNERTALLPPPTPEEWRTGEVHDLEDGSASKFQLISQECWVLLKGSLPVILAYALQNSLQTFSVLIVGRLSAEALATAAFSYMFAMATGWLIALGGTTAIDTLASASFTGSKNKHDLGIILQRSFIVLFLFYIPIAIMWFCSAPLFRALGQEEYIARDSARFLSVLAPGGLGYIYFEAMKKYLQAQGTEKQLCYTLSLSNKHRNYATRNVRSSHHLAVKRGSELPFRLHLEYGFTRSTTSHWYRLLGVILPARCLRTIRRRFRVLGRLESQVLTEHVDVRALGFPRSYPRWH